MMNIMSSSRTGCVHLQSDSPWLSGKSSWTQNECQAATALALSRGCLDWSSPWLPSPSHLWSQVPTAPLRAQLWINVPKLWLISHEVWNGKYPGITLWYFWELWTAPEHTQGSCSRVHRVLSWLCLEENAGEVSFWGRAPITLRSRWRYHVQKPDGSCHGIPAVPAWQMEVQKLQKLCLRAGTPQNQPVAHPDTLGSSMLYPSTTWQLDL